MTMNQNQNRYFKNLFWLICMAGLSYDGVFYVVSNIQAYLDYEVVTQIKVVNVNQLTFPAITFCFTHMDYYGLHLGATLVSQANLSEVLLWCFFEEEHNNCSIDKFEYIPVDTGPFYNTFYHCFRFNGGKKENVLTSSRIGIWSGLIIALNMSTTTQTYFHISGNSETTSWTDLKNIVEKKEVGKFVTVEMKQTVDTKLPQPYSKCDDNITADTSEFTGQIINILNNTYSQKQCYEICYSKYINKYIADNNLDPRVAYQNLKFDYIGNCSNVCPLECNTTTFDFIRSESRSKPDVLIMNFFYSDRKYLQISQIPKASMCELISNIILGLLFELSIFTIYKLLSCILEIFI